MERCVSVEALRYQYLAKLKPVHLKSASNGINRLLVLGDIQPETTHQMLLELEKNPTLYLNEKWKSGSNHTLEIQWI